MLEQSPSPNATGVRSDEDSEFADPASEAGMDAEAIEALDAEHVYQGRKLGILFWCCVGWLVVLGLAAIFADLLPLKDPSAAFAGTSRNGPSAEYWFGNSNIGADIFSQVIYGARRSLGVSFSATAAGLLVGGAIGLTAGFYRGSLESFITSALDVLLSFPALVLALALVIFLGQGAPTVALALAILAVPSIARVTRAATLVHSQREFVLASRTLGARNGRIMVREVLPNVLPAMFSFALINVAVLIVVEGALAFLGIGDATEPAWGVMINNGRASLDEAPHIVLFPALFMFLTILSLNLIGDKLQEILDVREAKL
ncbi:MAG: ABC transporter permease [Actinomycetota bacterium]|nr:ABC transporter permease [Actinomycetota bacterium]